ncbi:hypothetical protein HOO54_14520 [Bacillus sp. WMMC1349]|uniref:hypothetical protein n=1 Tax=Bacillus sp. WMMC1349 TaxID=2736254 RepID=UPI001554B3E1|nr:hypothetical protein [Bacillus sp. WMMC1349]NPC93417.1 hypothetical protein [Bacillus sp. WMMC1349]
MNLMLNLSIKEKTAIDMIYMRRDGQLSKRLIIVRQINKGYIRAYCLKSRQTKTFTIENILAVSLMEHDKRTENYALH